MQQTMFMTMNKTVEGLILYALGILCIPLGVVFTINSHAGAGGYDALNFALAGLLNFNISYAVCMTAILALFASSFIRRGFPRITCFITSYLFGISMDFWNAVLAGVKGDSLFFSAVFLAVGMVIVGAELPVIPSQVSQCCQLTI